MEKTPMKMLENKKLRRPTTASGAIGLLRLDLNSGMNFMRRKQTKIFATMIAPLPRRWIKLPIPLVIKKVAAFFNARTNACIADVQKFSPVRAI